MKIDIFCHVMLPKYKQALYKYADKFPVERAVQEKRPVLTDDAARLAKPWDASWHITRPAPSSDRWGPVSCC